MNHKELGKSQYFDGETSIFDYLVPKNDPKFMSSVRRWEKNFGFHTPLKWSSLIAITIFHIVAIVWYLGHLCYGVPFKWQSIIFFYLMGSMAGFGVTAGVHRFWTHRSYKASRPMQLILLFCYSVAGQNSVSDWVRDHRVHHKFSETSADPHDANRGFFFSHVGWLMMKKHPEVIRKGRKINMSDITEDSLIAQHTRYFGLLKLIFCFILPSLVPVVGWGERWDNAILSQAFLRYMLSLHFTWSVNSFAHLWGNKPYDKSIMPAENWGVSIVSMGEGWHNYHHTFPWDYKAAELPYSLNLTTLVLDGFARVGWVFDQKQASPALVRAVAMNRGQRN